MFYYKSSVPVGEDINEFQLHTHAEVGNLRNYLRGKEAPLCIW